jgi:ROS/MUCR transcriptional regulator protein
VSGKELTYYRAHFREAIQKDGVICLECGAIFKYLPGHLCKQIRAVSTKRLEYHESNIRTTRGLLILVARLTAREQKRIFSLCHYFARVKQLWENESCYVGTNEWQD